MIRLFLPPESLTSQQISITGDQARHLCLVLRIQPGDILTILDGQGHRHTCKTLKVNKKEIIAGQINKEPYSAESPVSITLAQGIPKGDKMDLIIQKSTELGVKKIVPIFTARSQGRHTQKVERWRKIALSASRQSGRNTIPSIEPPAGFEEFISRNDPGWGVLLYEDEKSRKLRKVLKDNRENPDIILLSGPEGGFSQDEVAVAVHKGFTSVSLGPRILRSETAPVTAISIIQYELGDMG